MSCRANASVVANEILTNPDSAFVTTAIIDVSTKLLALNHLDSKAIGAITFVSINTFSNYVNA
jgi:hypothetical protein